MFISVEKLAWMIMKYSDNRQMCDSKVINIIVINIWSDIYFQTKLEGTCCTAF